MPAISESRLRSRYGNYSSPSLGRSTQRRHTRANATTSVFLSHSSKDKDLALLVKEALESQGTAVYVDWLDDGLPTEITVMTARLIRERINSNNLLLLLAANNALASRSVPWELGYADGVHGEAGVAILPVERNHETYRGNEYVGLYRELTLDGSSSTAAHRGILVEAKSWLTVRS